MEKEVFERIKFDETNGCGLAKTVYDQTTKELSVLSLIKRVCEKESARMSNQYEVRFDEKELVRQTLKLISFLALNYLINPQNDI